MTGESIMNSSKRIETLNEKNENNSRVRPQNHSLERNWDEGLHDIIPKRVLVKSGNDSGMLNPIINNDYSTNGNLTKRNTDVSNMSSVQTPANQGSAISGSNIYSKKFGLKNAQSNTRENS